MPADLPAWSCLGTGLVLGLRHALDADHLLTVSALALGATDRRHAARAGLLWGAGHGLALLAVAGLAGLLPGVDPLVSPRLLEGLVAVTLLTLGVRLAWRAGRPSSLLGSGPLPAADHAASHGLPFVTGLLHGWAGSAALTLGTALALGTPGQRFLFLGSFSLAALSGMGVVGLLLASPRLRPDRRRLGLQRALHAGVAAAALVVGTRLLVG